MKNTIAIRLPRKVAGVTLLELLCVMVIIAILAAFYLGAISRAFLHVKNFLSFLANL